MKTYKVKWISTIVSKNKWEGEIELDHNPTAEEMQEFIYDGIVECELVYAEDDCDTEVIPLESISIEEK